MADSDEADLTGVPEHIAQAFQRGLDDVKHDRVVPIEAAIAEGRRRVAEHRRMSAKQAYGQAIKQRSETIP